MISGSSSALASSASGLPRRRDGPRWRKHRQRPKDRHSLKAVVGPLTLFHLSQYERSIVVLYSIQMGAKHTLSEILMEVAPESDP